MAQRQSPCRILISAASSSWRTTPPRPSRTRNLLSEICKHRRPLSRTFSSHTTPRISPVAASTSASASASASILPPTRPFSTTPSQSHNELVPPKPGEERHITFILRDNTAHTFTVSDGSNLLDIAQSHDLEMEGACGGSCACSTCHVIVEDEEMYDKIPEPSDDENDMLDLAFGLTETSRLGCQVEMRKELDGLVVRLPAMTRNMQASDFEERKKG